MILKIIIGVIFVPLILMNVIGPFVIKKVQKLPARISFNKHDEEEFLLNRDEEFHSLNGQIRNLGFEYIGSSFMEDSHIQTNFSLYSNENELTCAMVVSIVSKVKSITYVEYSQAYSDGSMLDVSNSDQVSPYPKMDLKLAVRYPEITDPEQLYIVFNKLKKSLNNSSSPIPYDKETGFKMVEEFMAKESNVLVSKGYCKDEIDENGQRSLTFKGACVLTWKSVIPGKSILNKLNLAYARKILKNA